MLQQIPTTELTSPQTAVVNTQPRRLQIALVLLLVLLAVVIVKDRDFWFGSDEALESEVVNSESTPKPASAAVPAKTTSAMTRASAVKNHPAAKPSTKPAVDEPSRQAV